MNRIYLIFVFLSVFILGCSPNKIATNQIIQKLNNLDLKIYSSNGEKIYSITSPYSTYDKNELKFQLKKTTINIFNGNEIKYIINSDESALSDNNKLLELKGNVILKTIDKDEDIMYSDKFIWNIKNNYYLLRGNIKFENKNIILNSEKATLDSNNIIKFFNPVKYIIKDDKNKNKYEINSENAYYNIDNKSVSFSSKEKRVRSIIYF